MKEIEEEAERIIELFYGVNNDKDAAHGTMPYISRDYAKQCALIYCEGRKIEAAYVDGLVTTRGKRWSFWQQVKEHIQNNY